MKLSPLQVVGLVLLLIGALGNIVLSSIFWWLIGERAASPMIMEGISFGENIMGALVLVGILIFLWDLGKALGADSTYLVSWVILLVLIIMGSVSPLWIWLSQHIGFSPYLAVALGNIIRTFEIMMIAICIMLLISTARKREGAST